MISSFKPVLVFNFILSIIFSFLNIYTISAQQAPFRFYAETERKQIAQGETFEVSFVIENGSVDNFQPPAFDGFEILAGPNQSFVSQSINGNWTRVLTYSFILRAKKIGKFSIGAAKVQYRSSIKTTNPITIEILKGNASLSQGGSKDLNTNQNKNQNIFIKTEVLPNNGKYYVGQQLIVDVKLYTQINISEYQFSKEPVYDGFFKEDIKRYDTRFEEVTVNGKRFYSRILKRMALFPQKMGLLSIPQETCELVVSSGVRRGYFSVPDLQAISLTSEPVQVNIKSLPTGAPDDFCAGVGSFSANASTPSNKISTDDIVAVQIDLLGDGDIKRVSLSPSSVKSDGFKLVQNKVLSEEFYDGGGQMRGEKKFVFYLSALKTGNLSLSPTVSYFDIDTQQYITLSTDTLKFSVTKGVSNAGSSAVNKVKDKLALSPIKLKLDDSNVSLKKFFFSSLYWWLFFIPLIFIAIVAFFLYRKSRRDSLPDEVRRATLAESAANDRLQHAKKALKSNNLDLVCQEVSKAMAGFIQDKFAIKSFELTKRETIAQLATKDVDSTLLSQIESIMTTCENALYAGQKLNADTANTLLKNATKVIRALD